MSTVAQRLQAWLRRVGLGTHTLPEAAQTLDPKVQLAVSAAPSSPRCASVVIPALNEAERIAYVVRHALEDPATAEVLVIDDSSLDETARLAREAGARVLTSSMLGKGASMRDGIQAAAMELVVFLDGDLGGLQPGTVSKLCSPLLHSEADFVKARFGRAGGRVTELTAKPMLRVFFPELAAFAQPLGGVVAARRSLLRSLSLEDGYGVDVGLLIDAWRSGARLKEVDIGHLEHDSQPLVDLTAMANEISRVIHTRARSAGRLHVEQISAMYEAQRQATASVDYILSRRRGRTRILLLQMDGPVTPLNFVYELARATHNPGLLEKLEHDPRGQSVKLHDVSSEFRFVHRQHFERVAHAMPIRAGVISCVNRMRRAGFMVGVVSDNYFIAAEILRRRIFADFALAHTLQFDADVCNGRLKTNTAFSSPHPIGEPRLCKSHVLRWFREDPGTPRVETIWVVGDHQNDLEMLRQADRAFVIDPKSPKLARDSDAERIRSFDEIRADGPELQRELGGLAIDQIT